MIIYCWILYFIFNTILAKECPRICGITSPPTKRDKKPKACEEVDPHIQGMRPSRYKRENSGYHKYKETIRIVNGTNAPDRGFMVLIRAISPRDPEGYETCGGALINNRYVVGTI